MFSKGRTNVEDEPQWMTINLTDVNLARVRGLVRSDRRLFVKLIAKELNIIVLDLTFSEATAKNFLGLKCLATKNQTVPSLGSRVGDLTAPNKIVEPMIECHHWYGAEHCHGATQFRY
ncbi:hypothetical protein J6590_043271 [Homalodisca vitripennis]|nr:hypothetical protein J6590_043271 [Homalodisca vitripennis]